MTIDEEKRRTGQIEFRYGSKARKERYNEADAWALVGEPKAGRSTKLSEQTQDGVTTIFYGDSSRNSIRIRHDPFGIEFARDGDSQVLFNCRGLLNIEQSRPKTEVDSPDGSSSEDESTSLKASPWTFYSLATSMSSAFPSTLVHFHCVKHGMSHQRIRV